jgi:sugar phosphate isomerase/epimerase
VGAHIWVYSARQPGADATPVLEQAFRELSAAGMDGVELTHTVLRHDDAVKRIGEYSRKFRLPVIGSSWSANMWKREENDAILADLALLMPRLRKLKGRTLGVSVGSANRKKTPPEFDAQADLLRKATQIAADHGVVLNLHNHVYEVADGEYDLKNTLERVPEAKLGPDIGWLYRAKVDPVDFIRRHGKRIVFAHLRDELANGKWPEAMGEGVMDYAAIGKALRETGFTGDLMIELAHERDFTPTRTYGESFRISREYVRTVMKY